MPERHRILIVDDNAEDRHVVVQALRRETAEIDGVEADVLEMDTIEGAREAIGREEFSCVFLAHELPDGTSLDLLMEVRSQGLVTPVVVLTGQRDVSTIVQVMQAGAVDYLPKEKLHPDLVVRSLRAALVFRKAQREKERVLDELRARDRAIAAAPNGIVIVDPCQSDSPLVYVNEAFLRMTGYAEEEVLGRNCRFLQGEGTDPAAVWELREAIREQRSCQVSLLNYRRDGTPFFNEVTVTAVRDARGTLTHFVGVQADITGRKKAEVERDLLAKFDGFLADLAERARYLTDPDAVIADAVRSVGEFLGLSRCALADIDIEADTCTVPFDYCADETVASIAGVFPISGFGPSLVAQFQAGRAVVVDDVRNDAVLVPEGSVPAYDAFDIRACIAAPVVHSSRTVSCLACHSATARHWTPEEVGLVQAVVERTWLTVKVLRQERTLRQESEATAAILGSVTDAFFSLDHDWHFTYVNRETERVLFKSRAELLGRYIWDVFPEGKSSTFDQQYRRAVAEGVAVSFEEFYPPLGAWLEVRAYPSDDGISVFFQNVNTRKATQDERERLLAEQRARAEREALLNRIGQALRSSPDPERVLETAVQGLGQALGADRCYFAAYDQDANTATVGPDWHREDLPSIAGQYPMSRFAVNRDPVYKAGRTQVVTDTAGDPATQALGLRALVRVPLASGASMTALSAAMADGPRQWTPEEVALVEAVATQTQTALEAVRVQRREHAIAQQLQDALQPALPAHVPGLSVGRFTQPALAEAEIGGDFFDIFPLDKELFAVVIGDVSGKGLAAAQQLALIRNSLRTTLYLYRSPAQAASALNKIVTSHDLLVGFVTTWVGVYDALTGEVVYCSCGHEPGLIRRSGGAVEETETTGPPLGVAENAEYAEKTITLTSGDEMLLYTDGISESGPSRREMLGTKGLIRVLTALPVGLGVQAEAEALVGEVRALAGGAFRDDVAVLLARRQ